MKTIKISLILSTFIFLLVSCDESYFPFNKKSISLKSELIYKDLFIGKPFTIIYHKDYLVFHDYYDEKLFSAINTKTGKMHRFGALGRGVGEFGPGTLIENYYDSIQILNRQDWRNYFIAIDSFIDNSNYRPQKFEKFNLTDMETRPVYYLKINKGTYLGQGVYNRNCLALMNKDSIISTALSIPASDKEKRRTYLQKAYQGNLKSNFDGSRFVFGMYNSDNINFYKIADRKIEVVKEYRDNFPDYVPIANNGFFYVNMNDNCVHGFRDISCNKKSVYAYFDESKHGDSERVKNSNTNKYIIKFDWNGNMKVKYSLDRKIDFFCVSDDNKKLFALSNSKIYVFNLL